MDFVLGRIRHLGVESANKLNVLVDLVRLHLVEDDGVYVFASSQDLTEAGLELSLHLSAFLGAVDKIRQRA